MVHPTSTSTQTQTSSITRPLRERRLAKTPSQPRDMQRTPRGIRKRRWPRSEAKGLRHKCFPHTSSSAASLSIHPRDLSTAFPQRLNHFSLVASSVVGLKILRLSRLMFFNSSNSFHTPTANPAAIAAPRAVVSRIWGRSTSIPEEAISDILHK